MLFLAGKRHKRKKINKSNILRGVENAHALQTMSRATLKNQLLVRKLYQNTEMNYMHMLSGSTYQSMSTRGQSHSLLAIYTRICARDM